MSALVLLTLGSAVSAVACFCNCDNGDVTIDTQAKTCKECKQDTCMAFGKESTPNLDCVASCTKASYSYSYSQSF